jgi:excisionase family DNA binding protein
MTKLYSTEGAAKYLKVKVRTMKKYIYEAKTLTGTLIGHSRVFTQEELDEFKKTKRGPGRPAIRRGDQD